MKQISLLITFIGLGLSTIFGQTGFADMKINEILRLEVDSFTLGKVDIKGNRFTGFLHYTVTNISDDTLMYLTNSCPSYNQYIFEMSDTIYYPNSFRYGTRCLFNSGVVYELLPNQSFSETEAMYENFSSLKLDMTSLKLTIPIDAEFPYKFKVGGYGTYSNVEELTFEGEILIIEY